MEEYFILLGLCMLYGHAFAIQEQSKLGRDLFQNYDKLTRPSNKADTPINVTISFQLKHIHDYDDKNRILSIYAWLKMVWTDPRLRWESFSYGDTSQIQIPYSRIWIPDVIMVNSIDPDVPCLPSSRIQALAYSNGTIFFAIPSMFRAPCTSSQQSTSTMAVSCNFQFMSWMHDGYEINLAKTDENTVDITEMSENPGMRILSTSAKRVVSRYACCPADIHKVEFTINIEPIGAESSAGGTWHSSRYVILLPVLQLVISI